MPRTVVDTSVPLHGFLQGYVTSYDTQRHNFPNSAHRPPSLTSCRLPAATGGYQDTRLPHFQENRAHAQIFWDSVSGFRDKSIAVRAGIFTCTDSRLRDQ